MSTTYDSLKAHQAMLTRCLRLNYHYAADRYARTIADELGRAYSLRKCERCGIAARLTDGYCDDCAQVVLDDQMWEVPK